MIPVFESGVISYGNKTSRASKCLRHPFESGVISYGNKTYLMGVNNGM